MFVQHMHRRNLHKTSTSSTARVASFIKLTVQKQVNKTRSLSREKTGSAKRLKARARGGKNGGTLPKLCQDARIKGCFLLKQSSFARLYCQNTIMEMNRTRSRLKEPSFLSTMGAPSCAATTVVKIHQRQGIKKGRLEVSLQLEGLINLCGNLSSLKPSEDPRKVYSHCILTYFPSVLKMIHKLMVLF